MNSRFLLVSFSVLFLAACSTRRIPGTDIPDTSDTRAILNVMQLYRAALEARDAQAIQKLASKSFRDNSGTDDPSDDLTYENLPQALPELFKRLESTQVDLDVRRVDVQGSQATAIYYWKATWRMPGLTDKPQRESELEQMVFELVDGEWKIVSGI